MATATLAGHRIVVVGGGAGGLPLATKLGDRYGRSGFAQITLVDRNATHVWKPLLHEVAAGRMDADAHDLDYLAIAHWHHFRFRQGAICGLDRARREITLDAVISPDGEEILPRRTLPYDTLVLCVGSVSNDFGVPGAAQHPICLDTLEDAERFHRRLLAVCVRADGRAAAGAAGACAHRHHRCRRDRRRARRGNPPDHPRARGLRSRSSQSRAGHPVDAARGFAADPAAIVRTRGGSRDRAPAETGRRRAHRGARDRSGCRRRAHGDRHVLSGRSDRMGCRHHGAGHPASSRWSRSEPRQSACSAADAADDARSVDLRVRRLCRRAVAWPQGGRHPAAAGAGRASASHAACCAR